MNFPSNAALFMIRASMLLLNISVVKVNGQIELSAGIDHACAFERTLAEFKCWGSNTFHQLNTGTNINQLIPVEVSLPAEITDVEGGVAGGYSTCMIEENVGSVFCVGFNQYGGLGIGSITNVVTSPTAMILPTNTRIVDIFMALLHSCMISDEKELLCTGLNDYGQLGLGDKTNRDEPVPVNGGHIVETAALGLWHTCFINDAFALLCMGRNEFGELGTGDNDDEDIPTVIDLGDRTVQELSCGSRHTCIITDLDRLLCTGKNDYGQLGIGTNSNTNVLTSLSQQDDDVIALAAGGEHTCFTIINKKVFCMGTNNYGQLGTGGNTDSNVPVEVDMPLSVTPMELALGIYHSCVSTTTNQVYCWGYGFYGQIGNGGTDSVNPPTLVQSIGSPAPTSHPTTPPTKSPTTPPTTSPTKSPSKPPTKSPTAPPTPCADRTDQWQIGKRTRNWCFWLRKQEDTIGTCAARGLEADCPVTCDACPTAPTPPTCSCDAVQTEVNTIKIELLDTNSKVQVISQQIEDVSNEIQRILDIIE